MGSSKPSSSSSGVVDYQQWSKSKDGQLITRMRNYFVAKGGTVQSQDIAAEFQQQ